MFTGIVEELGEVADITTDEPPGGAGPPQDARLTIRAPLATSDARPGDSIAVNGVCLTAVEISGGCFTADVMRETLDRSCLGALRPGAPVNLERAAKVSDRLGGHIVQGHADGTSQILERHPGTRWEVLRFSLPAGLARYLVEKGSVTVDGVSLTVASVDADTFTVSLIPATLERTTLGRKNVGDQVNIEVDIIAKYVERMVAGAATEGALR